MGDLGPGYTADLVNRAGSDVLSLLSPSLSHSSSCMAVHLPRFGATNERHRADIHLRSPK